MPVYKTTVQAIQEWKFTIRAGSKPEAEEIAITLSPNHAPDTDTDFVESCELPEDYAGEIDNEG